jgi:hypothetical protein
MKIPQGNELSGKKKAFDVRRTLNLAFGEQRESFGVIVEHPVDADGRSFPFCGWLGAEYGKTEPIVVEFHENPGQNAESKDLPAMRIYAVVDGVPTEVAALWKKVGNNTGKPFYKGKLGSADLTIFPYEKKATEGAQE